MKLIEKHDAVEVRRALAEVAARTSGRPVDERWEARSGHDRRRLWASLADEQRGVCAYCCTRLYDEKRIDHWAPRALRPDLVLDYDNLLACCSGARMPGLRHCDLRKDCTPITLSPLNASHLAQVRFERGGDLTFVGDDAATLSADATSVLGLNEEVLTELRRATFDGIWKALKATKDHRNVERLRREMARWESREDADEWGVTPYAAAVAGWLRHEIERLEADA